MVPFFSLHADEGMWLFNAAPLKRLKEQYHFQPSPQWLDHLQKSSVRFNNGGSGSFISHDGLIITNHHIGSDVLQKFSDAQHNYLRDGFYAPDLSQEKRCYDLELNVLMSIEDVTERVNSAVPKNSNPEQALAARRSVIAEIEKESTQKTSLRSDVVTLFEGGSYQLYRYKRYTDVRLVFAPEEQIAFFGGDPDNFEFPRYCYDICLFRAYENGKPAAVDHFLKFNNQGPADLELVFVSGNPGSTERQFTVAEFTDIRDRALPQILRTLFRREVLYSTFCDRSLENALQGRDELFYTQNSRKALKGRLEALLDPQFFGQLVDQEKKLRSELEKNPDANREALAAYDKIESAQGLIADNARVFDLFEGPARRGPLALNSELFQFARNLVRVNDERKKPNGERLPEYQDAGKPSLELKLFSEAPIYKEVEKLKLTDSLTELAERLGADNPLTQAILDGKSPQMRAAELVDGTQLKDVAVRKKIYEGGDEALKTFGDDPMIALATKIDDTARAARKNHDEQTEIKAQAYGEIAKSRFALLGANTYPDATFTLRLAYGKVQGYTDEATKKALPAFTTFAGLYERAAQHNNQPPFQLPQSWVDHKKDLNLGTPFNFVSTADIIGGNSGSPVVNKAGEFVGIIFDGNLESLALDYAYTDKQARAISVDSRAIYEGLKNVYNAAGLVKELESGKLP